MAFSWRAGRAKPAASSTRWRCFSWPWRWYLAAAARYPSMRFSAGKIGANIVFVSPLRARANASRESSAAQPQPKRRNSTTKSTKVTNNGTAIAVPFRKIQPRRPVQVKSKGIERKTFYIARFAPYVFFVPFVVNFLKSVLRELLALRGEKRFRRLLRDSPRAE